MQSRIVGLAPAFSLFPNIPHKTFTFHQILVLIVTFIAYASFHASRKPPSIVKSVLGPPSLNSSSIDNGWAPFNGTHGTKRLGELDLAFLSSYALGMYFAGHLGDRIDLRYFLVFGMMGSGILTVVFGLGYWMNVHLLWFYMSVQIVCGLFQSIGWPCVVSVVGNWCGKEKRGLIMGVWNSHTSVGNILGSVIASSVLDFGWGWSFVLPGGLVIVSGVVVFMFLVVSPHDLGFEEPGKEMEIEMSLGENVEESLRKQEAEDAVLLENVDELDDSLFAIGFLEAWRLPGVAPYAFCLFFSKLVAYTFLYWLPYYLRHTAVAGVNLSHKTAGILSTVFDIGGVLGGISAGFISDKIKARALTSITFLALSIPALIMYRIYGSVSMFINIVLMFISGLLVNGPYALITTAVAADLGTQDSIKGNGRALATVTAIIDGTGSVGAALGPLLAGYISSRGWNSVFFMLIVSIFFAGLFLVRLAKAEISKMRSGELIVSSDPQS
ncbi:Major facilitator superfamily domain [Arabidopsis thaliana x Arabidopsis arenosa]|uniref:Major facilitator superfamily domain n=1 Tax=Arabidopsis thaliana x Arabidopsis arenosa TaxID=1240361 RepID=A0A8T2B4V8_9BRAS|nr:Major facilitator superfamily domain [Arabidopsis thaliana x Arabidopsis arenosa]